MLPGGYLPPQYLEDLRTLFTNDPWPGQRSEVPRTQVIIRAAPQLQERELLEMVRTWFGMGWPGNPCVIGG